MSVVRFTRSALPHLRGSTLRRIINVSSISAVQPGYYNPHYTVTKAAVLNLGKYLANALANENILVNTICPGPVKTEAWEMNVRKVSLTRKISDYEARELVEKEEISKIPLRALGEGVHIASAVALLASPLSSWTTGSCIHINGGKLNSS